MARIMTDKIQRLINMRDKKIHQERSPLTCYYTFYFLFHHAISEILNQQIIFRCTKLRSLFTVNDHKIGYPRIINGFYQNIYSRYKYPGILLACIKVRRERRKKQAVRIVCGCAYT